MTTQQVTRVCDQDHSNGIAARPKFRSLIRLSFRFFAALLGLGLLGYLVFRTGPEVVWKQVQIVGWGFALIIILGGLSQLIRTCAWRQTITGAISVGFAGHAVLARSWPRMRPGNWVLLGRCSGRGSAYL